MKEFLTLVIIVITIIACGNGANGLNNRTNANLDLGKKLFKQYCVACHGIDGQLGLNGAKDFRKSTLSLGERVTIISEGRKLMTPFKGLLNEEEIKAVANYTLELSKIE